jgi:hypothetical protein
MRFLLPTITLSIGCASSVEVDELRAQVTLDCGEVQHGPSPVCAATPDVALSCFIEALPRCTRARLRISQTYTDSGESRELFLVPRSGACDVIEHWKNADGWPPPGSSGQEETLTSCEAAASGTTDDGCPTVAVSRCSE